MSEMSDTVKITLLLASTLILVVVFVFTGLEGILNQMNRHLIDALVYYLISIASLTGVLWAYSRSRQLIRALPFEE